MHKIFQFRLTFLYIAHRIQQPINMKSVICLTKSRIVNKKYNYFCFLLQFIAVLCLVLSTNVQGLPASGPNPQEIALAKVTNQGASIDTAFGN